MRKRACRHTIVAWYTGLMEERGHKLLRTLFVYIWVLALAHMAAQHLYLYWTYKWLDIPMHFLGGIWVGLAALWLWYYSGYARKPGWIPHHPFVIALGGGLAFGVLWECYDFLVWKIGVMAFPANYVADTALDLLMDATGAVAAYNVFRFLSHRARRRDAADAATPQL